MTPVTRTAQFTKVHKVLKKHYKPSLPPAERPVLEHLLFACCLEDARYEAAEEAFAAVQHTFFDWNEIRVTSISELSEVMSALPDSRVAANRVKRVLHAIFEQLYCFDLEDLRKKNLGPTEEWLRGLDGSTKFAVAYVIQAALDGHSIPVDCGTLAALRVLDLVTDKDVAEGMVPGLERAVAKAKGMEFGSLLHQLGADYTANPYAPRLREILVEIEPGAAQRFPQRRAKAPETPPGKRHPRGDRAAKPGTPPSDKPSAEPAAEAPRRGRKKKLDAQAKPAEQPPTAEDLPSGGNHEHVEGKKPGRPPSGKKSPHPSEEVPPADQEAAAAAEKPKEKSAAEGLAKRKPR